jgi:putative spermidine/putrescine transport system ATP-binding protein
MSDARALPAPLGLRGLAKHYGALRAIDSIDLDVEGGEFVTFLGPSGSGKTTTLKMIAGFISPTAGEIHIDGKRVTAPPHKRDIGMVFQNYALFPHMTATQNIAFPLTVRRLGKSEVKRRVAEALELVHLEDYGNRYPRQLSGGQQQRIALARALVFRPRVVLMDEPLGALDKKLRERLQLEIKRIQATLNITMIYVTHDQEEALVMSDRIAVFNRGKIEQVAPGETLYERPSSLFVADFIGESNLLRGRIERDGQACFLVGDPFRLAVSAGAVGQRAALVVRPERLRLCPANATSELYKNALEATVKEIIYLGGERKYELLTPGGLRLIARQQIGEESFGLGDAVIASWPLEHGVLVPDDMA